jgi:uncharacterized membrane protein
MREFCTGQLLVLAVIAVVCAAVIGTIFSGQNAVQVIGFSSLVVVSLLSLAKQYFTAQEVEKVKSTLARANTIQEIKSDELMSVAKATHVLVNSKMQVQLELAAAITKRLAVLTGDEADRKAAKTAHDLLEDHKASQTIVDEGKKNG